MDWSTDEYERVLQGVSRLGWIVLKRFSASYKPSDILSAFACLPRGEFELLRRLHFALSHEVAVFLDVHAAEFLRATPSTTEHVLEDRRGTPRGRIDWSRTFARRTQSGSDPTRFVTRPIERTSDSAPARLFTYMLDRVVKNAEWLLKRKVPEIERRLVDASLRSARLRLASLRGRGVSQPARLTGRDVAPLRASRRSDVVGAIRLFDLYVNLVELANENLLRALLQDRQMAPDNLDDLFEIWVLLNLVGSHLREGWTLKSAFLIGGESAPKKPRFTLEKEGRVAELYFQTVPLEMSKSSSYKAIFEDYDLDASLRRPDITCKVSSPLEGEQRLIIEVKRTQDSGYILDSVYKTLGYLADFKDTVGPNAPQALLVVWSGLSRKPGAATHQPIRITTASEFEQMPLLY
ncbi:hypothetical protein [Mesorhizobium sp. M0276]|uniref:hypothetical protein n=1 Tax=Mesorhizobium sp. M0276 TaxID=2956928 RepID=UPI003335A5B4